MPLHERVFKRLMRRFANRPADVTIGGSYRPYLRRWFVIPRNRVFNIYLHQFLRSDDDRALHDHPWAFNASWLLDGSYMEVAQDKEFPGINRYKVLNAGRFKLRFGASPHRVMLFKKFWPNPGENHEHQVWTLFITGPKVREWGFHCPTGWKHWKDFTGFRSQGHGHEIGPGCDDEIIPQKPRSQP